MPGRTLQPGARDLPPEAWQELRDALVLLPWNLRGAFVARIRAHTGMTQRTVYRRLKGQYPGRVPRKRGYFLALTHQDRALLEAATTRARGAVSARKLWQTVLGSPERVSIPTVTRWLQGWRRASSHVSNSPCRSNQASPHRG